MNIYDEFFSIVKKLDDENIQYALIGGIALSFYTEPRFTKDIDFLLLANDIKSFKLILNDLGYKLEAETWTLKEVDITLHRLTKIDNGDFLSIDLLVGNDKKYDRIINNAVTENTEYGVVSIAAREDLIWLKQLRNSKQDIADIEALKNVKD